MDRAPDHQAKANWTHRHEEFYRHPRYHQRDADAWADWTDAEHWELGPETDNLPVAPYSDEDANWRAEQTRDADQTDDTDAPDPAHHADLDELWEEREAEDRYYPSFLS